MLADGAVEPQGTGEQRFAAQLRQRQIGPIAGGAAEAQRERASDASPRLGFVSPHTRRLRDREISW